jgi:hypothetical protein
MNDNHIQLHGTLSSIDLATLGQSGTQVFKARLRGSYTIDTPKQQGLTLGWQHSIEVRGKKAPILHAALKNGDMVSIKSKLWRPKPTPQPANQWRACVIRSTSS